VFCHFGFEGVRRFNLATWRFACTKQVPSFRYLFIVVDANTMCLQRTCLKTDGCQVLWMRLRRDLEQSRGQLY
jgi:hypothetical protein